VTTCAGILESRAQPADDPDDAYFAKRSCLAMAGTINFVEQFA